MTPIAWFLHFEVLCASKLTESNVVCNHLFFSVESQISTSSLTWSSTCLSACTTPTTEESRMSIYWWIANGMWQGTLLLLLPSGVSAFCSFFFFFFPLRKWDTWNCQHPIPVPWEHEEFWTPDWSSVMFDAGRCDLEHKIVLKCGEISSWIRG